jgi:hypothetical protein
VLSRGTTPSMLCLHVASTEDAGFDLAGRRYGR